jgi:hypothetical protein
MICDHEKVFDVLSQWRIESEECYNEEERENIFYELVFKITFLIPPKNKHANSVTLHYLQVI